MRREIDLCSLDSYAEAGAIAKRLKARGFDALADGRNVVLYADYDDAENDARRALGWDTTWPSVVQTAARTVGG